MAKVCSQCKKVAIEEWTWPPLCKKCKSMRGKGAYDPTFQDWRTGDDV